MHATVPRRCFAAMVPVVLCLLVAAMETMRAEPLFLRNHGQWNARAFYRLQLPGARVWFTRDAVVYDLWDSAGGSVLRQEFDSPAGTVEGVEVATGRWNFIRSGSTVRDVEGAREVWYRNVRPGISLRYYLEGKTLKYDVLAEPGADVGALRFRWQGVRDVCLERGEVVVGHDAGALREGTPVAWQVTGAGERRPVRCSYDVAGREVGYRVGTCDPHLPLVIDPAITFGTYVGGEFAESGRGVSTDSAGNIYTVGLTRSEDFPTTPGAYRRTIGSFTGASDLFVAKYDPTGTVLLFGTYIGGHGGEDAAAIRVVSRRAPNGAQIAATVLVAGTTFSTDFPTTPDAHQSTSQGGADGFLLGLSPDGRTLLFSTLIGGESDDVVTGLEIGNFENLYVCGWSRSFILPTSQSFLADGGGGEDAFVARYSARADTLKWMVRYGGAGDDRAQAVAVEPGGAAWTTGWTRSASVPVTDSAVAMTSAGGVDAFVLRVRFNGAALDYGTMIGGSGDDLPAAIAVDAAKGATVTGRTTSANYPLAPSGISSTGGSWFVSRFPFLPSRTPLYSRTLGVPDGGGGAAVAVAPNGEAVLAGTTTSFAFPVTSDATLATPRGARDLAVVRLSANGSVVHHAAAFGGSGEDSLANSLVLQGSGGVVLAGTTNSPNLPLPRPTHDSTLNARGSTAFTDAFILRYTLERRPAIHAVARRTLPPLRCDSVTFDTLMVYNIGDTELTVTAHRFSSGAGSSFSVVSPIIGVPPLRLAPGDSLRYIVRARFMASDTLRDTLEILSNDSTPGKRPLRITYQAVRAPVVLQAQPSSLAFSSVLTCASTPGERNLVLRNVGVGALTVTSIEFEEKDQGFSVASPPRPPFILSEGAGITLRLLFRPAGRGLHRDTLLVRIAECSQPLRVPVSGIADSAATVLPIRAINLGDIALCRFPVDTSVTLFNVGSVPLVLNATASDTSLRLPFPSLPDTIAAGASQGLRLRAQLREPGAFRLVLHIVLQPCGLIDSVVVSGRVREGPTLEMPAQLALDTVAGCGTGLFVVDTTFVVANRGVDAVTVDTLDFPAGLIGSPLPVLPLVLGAGDTVRFPVSVQSGAGPFDLRARFTATANGCTDTLPLRVDGVMIHALPAVSPASVTLPLLQECEFSHDTVVTISNSWPVPITVADVGSGGLVQVLDPLPLALAPHASMPVRVRYIPGQSGVARDTLLLITAPCGDTVRVVFEGEKRGAVVHPVPGAAHLTPLSCEGEEGRIVTLRLRNDGDGPSAALRAAAIAGENFVLLDSLQGRVIAQGAELPVRVRYTGSATDGADSAVLIAVLDPCGDTVRVPLDAVLDTLPRVVLRLDVGDLLQGGDLRIDTGFINPARSTLRVEGASVSSPSLTVDSIASAPSGGVASGERVRLLLRSHPVDKGRFSDTVWVHLSEPCADSVAVIVEGRVLAAVGDTLHFCIDEPGAGSAGDTLDLPLSADQARATTDTVRVAVIYDAAHLALVGARTATGEQVRIEDRRGTATLYLAPGALAGAMPVSLRFLLLAGRGGVARVSVDSVRGADIVAEVCGRSATVVVADRCLVTGVAFGRYASLVEPVRPSPARESVEVTWQQLEDASTVVRFVDAAGYEKLRALDGFLPGGRYTVQVPLRALPAGWYLLVIEAGAWRGVQQVQVVR